MVKVVILKDEIEELRRDYDDVIFSSDLRT